MNNYQFSSNTESTGNRKIINAELGIIEKSILSKKINLVVSEIKKFSSNSEHNFLSVGKKLQKYHSDSRELTNAATNISSTISDSILKKGTEELSELLNCTINFLKKSSNEIKNDKQIIQFTAGKLNSLSEELSGFERIVKRLRMLGISTKIESARLGMEDEGFVALAENVDKLGGVIHEKISIISNKTSFLEKEILRTISELDYIEGEHDKQSEKILNNSVKSLEDFKRKQIEASDNIGIISRRSVIVSQNISGIVSSIQFHDITRQQMDHACEALFELVAGQHNINDELDPGYVHDVFELQSIQLSNALKEFTSAVNNIVTNLNNVEKNIGDIFSKSLESLCKNENGSFSDLNILEEELRAIISGLLENIKISERLGTSIKSIVDIVDDLLKYVSEIEEVGDEIEIIAINARVKAARFGNSGAALGVLAESIQKLSAESKNQTNRTSKILFELGEESRKLGESLKNTEANENKNTIGITVDKINQLLVSMKNMEQDSCKMVDEVKNNVNELKKELINTAQNITIHEDAKKSIGPIIDMLNETVSNLNGNFSLDSNREKNTKELMKKYTMNTERKIHNSFTGEQNSFNGLDNLKIGRVNDESLGDNVELF